MINNDNKSVISVEQSFNLYKSKLKKLDKISNDQKDLLLSFNGEISKAKLFENIINSAISENKDDELLKLCEVIFPKLFKMEDEKLKVLQIKIKKDDFEFTKDQKKACKKFVNFFMNPEKHMFGLYGFSGTGKTTTLIEIVSYMLSNKFIKSAVFSAPTNKAVNVMKNKFEKYIRDIYTLYSKKTKDEVIDLLFDDLIWKLAEFGIVIEFSTIHKLLNFDSDFDAEGKLVFKKSNNSDVLKYDLIVIDECSMLPAQMIDTIFTDIRENTKLNPNNNMKIVFSGDIAQLPPVNEKNSIIFSKEMEDFPFESYIDSFGFDDNDIVKKTCFKTKYEKLMKEIIVMEHFVMKTVVRSKSGNVLGVCNIVRDWALDETDKFKIGKFIDSLDCYAYKYNKIEKKTNTDWFNKFIEQCKNVKDSIILTWTNKQCVEYNNEIRKILFEQKGEEKMETYVRGDILMLNDFYSMKQDKDDGNKFYTSEQIKIIDLEIVEKPIELFPMTLNKNSQKLENANKYEEQYKKIIGDINSSVRKTYKCWKLYVKRLSSNRDDGLCIIYVIHDDCKKIHEAEKEFISNCVKKLRIKLVTKFKEKTSVIDNHIIKYIWKNFHGIYVQPFANVNYGYCITSHKAQGSTFYDVFVDIEDIVKNTNANEMKRCLYTAVSRTSNQLHLLI
jgi:hypothetical protein